MNFFFFNRTPACAAQITGQNTAFKSHLMAAALRSVRWSGQDHSSIIPNHVIGATLPAATLGEAPTRRALNRQPPGLRRSALLKDEVPDEAHCSVT